MSRSGSVEREGGGEPDDLPVEIEADFAPLAEATEAPETASSHRVDPFQRESMRAQEAFDAAVEAAAAGHEEEAVRQFLRAAKIAEVAREWYLSAVACQRVGDFLLNGTPPYDPERALRMYRRAVAAYEQTGLFHEARVLAYRLTYEKMRRARELNLSLRQTLELYLAWAVAGYGYRPLRVIGSAVVTVFGYGVLYWLIGGVEWNAAAERVGFWHALYFSGITFATVGYGDFLPAPHARLIALTEGFVGVFMLGLFTAVLAARLRNT